MHLAVVSAHLVEVEFCRHEVACDRLAAALCRHEKIPDHPEVAELDHLVVDLGRHEVAGDHLLRLIDQPAVAHHVRQVEVLTDRLVDRLFGRHTRVGGAGDDHHGQMQEAGVVPVHHREEGVLAVVPVSHRRALWAGERV